VNQQSYRPFYYYATNWSRPLLCEIDQDGYVYMSHSDKVMHRSKYDGVFVPLIEYHGEIEQEPVHVAKES
jgi:hypothetical protein